MPPWKSALLALYLYGTLPLRKWRNALAAAEGHAPVMVLYYHRIADDAAGEWTFPFALFQRHMRWLRKHFDLVSLGEAQRRIRDGNHRPCVAITFDDGYSSNCDQALPLLVAEKIPCTYFVTSQNVLHGLPFEHDVVRHRPLNPNTVEQLRHFADAGIEIGCHTRTHADMALCTPEALHEELVTARDELESALDRPMRYFAFPFGHRVNMSPQTFAIARAAGYEAVCSAYGGYNFPGDDPFHLQRIPADTHMLRMKNWLTVDPRKVAMHRYDYRPSPPQPASGEAAGL
ncbi:MAG: polysaccharide deacetylase family protein [Pirellulales bacterium]